MKKVATLTTLISILFPPACAQTNRIIRTDPTGLQFTYEEKIKEGKVIQSACYDHLGRLLYEVEYEGNSKTILWYYPSSDLPYTSKEILDICEGKK